MGQQPIDNKETPDSLQLITFDLSGAFLDQSTQNDSDIRSSLVIKVDLPAFAREWSKCFVQIHVDDSPNPVRTKSTKKGGQHEWGERFSL